MSKPQQELRVELSEILVKWGVPTRQVAISEMLQLIEQTLHDCLPEKLEPLVPGQHTVSDSFNHAIDQAEANFKRRMENEN